VNFLLRSYELRKLSKTENDFLEMHFSEGSSQPLSLTLQSNFSIFLIKTRQSNKSNNFSEFLSNKILFIMLLKKDPPPGGPKQIKAVEELKMTNGVLRVLIKKFKIKIFLLKNEKLLLMICFILSYDL